MNGSGRASPRLVFSHRKDISKSLRDIREQVLSRIKANRGGGLPDPLPISQSEAQRIQNAADRIGKPIHLVGSRAKGTAQSDADWDYVIEGMTKREKDKIKNSLPGAPNRADQVPRNIDFFKTPLDPKRPRITFEPKKG